MARHFSTAILAALIVSASALHAAEIPTDKIKSLVEREYPSLDGIYRQIHTNPELSMFEEKTAALLAAELKELGFDVTEKVGGHGVVAVMKNGSGKTLLLRADMDALPVKEMTGAAYASQAQVKQSSGAVVDVMHACGHDIHVTNLIGTARALAALKEHWSGTLVLIGQPAEEIGAGARLMLKDGLFARFPRPDFCLALHVDSELESGKVGYVPGYAMANVDSVDITVRGVGGHGAQPHQNKDPIVLAAQIVLALQTIDSREVHPREPVVVTVGSIHGGTKHNITPDEVKLQLTVRTYKDETRKQVLEAIDRIAKKTAEAAGVPKDREPVIELKDEFTPATYNTPELVERVRKTLAATVGTDNVVERDPSMGGEDFGRYGREEPKIPICMYRLGSVPAEKLEASKKEGGPPLPGLHSGLYLPDRQSTLKTGVLTLTAAAIDLLGK